MQWRAANRDKDRLTFKKYRKSHPEKDQEYRKNLRLRALKKISPIMACCACGCDKYDLLEINHKNCGGSVEIKKVYGNNQNFYLAIANGKRAIDDLNLLCRMCNILHYLEVVHGKLPYELKWNHE